MRRVMVRYKVKPERVAEHEGYIRAVFDDLAKVTPTGFRYGAFKQPDGVSFVHVASIEGDTKPLDALASFKAFIEAIKERCEEPPSTIVLAAIGAYGL